MNDESAKEAGSDWNIVLGSVDDKWLENVEILKVNTLDASLSSMSQKCFMAGVSKAF